MNLDAWLCLMLLESRFQVAPLVEEKLLIDNSSPSGLVMLLLVSRM